MVLDYLLKTCAVLVMLWALFNAAAILMLTETGIIILFFLIFAITIAVFTGAGLLIVGSLYPESVNFGGFTDLWLLVVSSALVSTVFLLGAERPLVRVLRRLTSTMYWADVLFVFAHGLVTTLLLTTIGHFVLGVELTVGAAVVAGLIGAFGFYFAELVFVNSGSTDSEEMVYLEASLEDEED